MDGGCGEGSSGCFDTLRAVQVISRPVQVVEIALFERLVV